MRLHPHSPRAVLFRTALLTILCFSQSLSVLADSVVVPNIAVTTDSAFGSGVLQAANYRHQSAYGSNHFPQDIGLLITELRYRPDYFYGRAFTTTVANIQFNLSTTTRNPESLNSTFANNIGGDETVVFSGALTFSSRFIGPANGPKEFDIVVPLTTPFLYNPAAGHLLVDMKNFSGAPNASLVSGLRLGNDNASRLGNSITASSSTPDSAVEAIQIVYIPTNQPPPPPPPPPRVLRGPYVQNATMTNIIVRWRTSSSTNSVVRFGLSDTGLVWAVTNLTLTSQHSIQLTNLAPGTRYFYTVGATETNLAGGSNFFFQTAPATTRPVRIWAMGDFGTTGIYGNGALGVRDAYYSFAGNRYTDVWLMLGDNAYPDGRDEEYQRAVFEVYQNIMRQTVAWSTIGNHETYASNALGHIAYYDIFDLPAQGEAGGVPSGTEKYYSFDYANIHFVCLDSEFSNQTADGPMATWLREDLMANSNLWVIAYWHSPPYTKGSHDSDNDFDTSGHLKNMREVFVPILESYGVDLVLCGHSHIYERSHLIHGHYGKSHTFNPSMLIDGGDGRPLGDGAYAKFGNPPDYAEGTVYIVAGSGGFATAQVGVHPVMYATMLQMGSLVLDVDGGRLEAKFLRNTGAIDDSFTILKEHGPVRPRIERIEVDGGMVTLEFTSVVGQQYRVEHATQLGPANWEPVSGILTANDLLTIWTDASSPTGNHFYRIEIVSP